MRRKVLTLVGGVALVAVLAIPSIVLAVNTSPRLKSRMTGEQVVPAGTGAPQGEGRAKIRVRPAKRKLCFKVTYSKIGNTKGLNAGIYHGKKGENGELELTLFAGKKPSPVKDCVKASKKVLRPIKRHPRRHNLDIKTAKYHQGGAIRGQLKPAT